MANQKHLDILRQGVSIWNEWRKKNPHSVPDLSESNLEGADLGRANLKGAFIERAEIGFANLEEAILTDANLQEAFLSGTNFRDADLEGANLRGAVLFLANITGANLKGVDFKDVMMDQTSIGNVDLSNAKNLEKVIHWGPSSIGIDTLYNSKGHIPKSFLSKAGVPANIMKFISSLSGKEFQYYSCFISFRSNGYDIEFATKLHSDLQKIGVRCWFAPYDMNIGDKIRSRMETEIRNRDKLIIILSSQSIQSKWVEKEVETAFEEEGIRNKKILLPVMIDHAVMDTDQAWAADIRRTRHIGDFSDWEDSDSYRQNFNRVVQALKD